MVKEKSVQKKSAKKVQKKSSTSKKVAKKDNKVSSKTLLKNKIFWIGVSILVLLIIFIIILLVTKKDTVKEFVENSYTVYLMEDSNYLVEIEFIENYYVCTTDGEENICEDKITEVTNIDALDESVEDALANGVFLEVDIIYSLANIVNSISDVRENFNDIVLLSNYEFSDDMLEDLQNRTRADINYQLDYQEKLNGIDTNGSNNLATETSNKINLNDNITATVYTESTGMPECFFYIYSDNIEELYTEAEFEILSSGAKGVNLCPGPREDALDTELVMDDFNNSNLVYNTSNENALKEAFDKYDDTPGFLVNSFTNDNHKISFEYEYIILNDLEGVDGTEANSQIQSLLKGSYLIKGPCGGFDKTENVTVNEEICEKFNLNCGRW